MEDFQVAPQQVSGVGEVVDYVHNHTYSVQKQMALPLGCQLYLKMERTLNKLQRL